MIEEYFDRIDPGYAWDFAIIGLAFLSLGLALNWPETYAMNAVMVKLFLLKQNIFLVAGVFILTGMAAHGMRYVNPVLAEYTGAISISVLLMPAFIFMAGLPGTTSWTGIFIPIGGLLFVLATSYYLATWILGKLRQ